MSRVFLSDSLRSILRSAAHRAVQRRDTLRVDDLLAALLEDTIGSRIAAAVAPVEAWPTPVQSEQQSGTMRLHFEQESVAFEHDAERLFQIGADTVILGEYEPRHLALAVGSIAATARAPFARYGLDPYAWQNALK